MVSHWVLSVIIIERTVIIICVLLLMKWARITVVRQMASCICFPFLFFFFFFLFVQMRIDEELKVEHVKFQWNELKFRAKQTEIVIYLNVHFRTSVSDPFPHVSTHTHTHTPTNQLITNSKEKNNFLSLFRRQSFQIQMFWDCVHCTESKIHYAFDEYFFLRLNHIQFDWILNTFYASLFFLCLSILISILNWNVRKAYYQNDQRTITKTTTQWTRVFFVQCSLLI